MKNWPQKTRKMVEQWRLVLYCTLIFVVLLGCTNQPNKEEEANQTASKEATTEPVSVQATMAKKQPFTLVLLSNGHVVANNQSKLTFKVGGIIEKIFVANGAAVRAGQLLAQLENREAQLALQQASLQIAEARVEINDLLISQGGRKGDSSSVKPDVWVYIKLRSGYERAMLALQKARNDLDNTYLRAPYAGMVANLKIKPYNNTSSAEPFCTLLSKEALWVEFSVLETELSAVQIGQLVQIIPIAYADTKYNAQVVEINPLVNEQGLVLVKVKILKPDQRLFEGMNAHVKVEKQLGNQLTIPKEAVVERSGRKVVFTAENGLAKWHYITVGHENDTHLTITEGLKAGEQVIVEGNLNLGHDAKIKLQ